MLYTANLPKYLQGEAVEVATFLYNRTPYIALDGYSTLYYAKNGTKPSIANIRIFGSICYYRDNAPKLKLSP